MSGKSIDWGRVTVGIALVVSLAGVAVGPLPGRARRLLPGDRADRPLRRPGVHARHRAAVAAARDARVILLGDSLTARWLTAGRPAWDRELAPLGAACLGVGEDRVEHLLDRLESGEFDGLDPGAVVLMVGTNNLPLRPAAEIAAGLGRCVADCRRIWPEARVVVLSILPRSDRGAWFFRDDLVAVNRRLAALDDGDRVRYLDLDAYLCDDGRYLRPELTEDGLHLTAAGYDAIARPIRAALAGPGR